MKKRITISMIIAILFVIIINYNPVVKPENNLYENLEEAINEYGVFYSVSALSLGYCIYIMNYKSKYKKKFNIWIFTLSVFLSVILIVGKYYINKLTLKYVYHDSFNLIFNLIGLIVYTKILYMVFFNLFKYIDNFSEKYINKNDNKLNKVLEFILDKHSFLASFVIIMLCGLPYIIFFYPGTVQPDGNNQLVQYLTGLLSSQHPFLITIMLGTCYKMGTQILNNNFGVFLFTFLQFIFSSIVLAYSVKLMKDLKIPRILRLIALIYFSLFTIWPINAYTYVKDTLYYLIFLIIIMQIIKYVQNEKYQKSIVFNIFILITCIALCITRKNGVYVVGLTLISLFFLNKNIKRIILLTLILIVVVIYNFFIDGYINQKFNVEPGSVKEALSLPIQQIALVTIRYGNEINDQDREQIENIYNLKFDEIKNNYIPESADNLKIYFKYVPTKEELHNYIELWVKLGMKYPLTYVDAFLNNFYGYFYPDRTEYKDGLGWYSIEGGAATFDDDFKNERENTEKVAYIIRDIPVIGLLYSTGWATWMLFIVLIYLIYAKQYKYILILVPSIGTLMICCISPVNAYIRYSLPIMVNLPLLLSLMFNCSNMSGKRNLISSNTSKDNN